MQVHIVEESTVADHCRRFSLSDPNDEAYQSPCNHDHTDICKRCRTLDVALSNIRKACSTDLPFSSEEEKEEFFFIIDQAANDIKLWKAHQLRSVNQDQCKQDILSLMDFGSVMITLDWAMKYLPRKYRESQSDWFAKRGLPWHISVVMKKTVGADLETMAIIHIFESTKQDSNAVISLLQHVLEVVKHSDPSITTAYLRQDNAGCYHSANTILGVRELGKKTGIQIKRMDFSDPQGGKGPCDRKAAQVKRHMNIHLNEGNDILSAQQMKKAMLSSGGIPSVKPFLVEMPKTMQPSIPWSGISFINNFQFTEAGLRVWRAYNIGPGRLIQYSSYQTPVISKIRMIDDYMPRTSFQQMKSKREPPASRKARGVDQETSSYVVDSEQVPSHVNTARDETKIIAEGVFCCPEKACTGTYMKHSGLEKHVLSGKHSYQEEKESLLDLAKRKYAEVLSQEQGAIPKIRREDIVDNEEAVDPLPEGWALKTIKRAARFSRKQKEFLEERFEVGEVTGCKEDPVKVAKQMRLAKDSKGQRRFNPSEYLTSQQISSFFSRLASKRRTTGAGLTQKDLEELSDEIEDCCKSAYELEQLENLTRMVQKELGLTHPIMCGTLNICELVKKGKLSSSTNIQTLVDICKTLGISTSDVTSRIRRKAPYADKIKTFVNQCSCSQR